jgi:hypothetical protein
VEASGHRFQIDLGSLLVGIKRTAQMSHDRVTQLNRLLDERGNKVGGVKRDYRCQERPRL